MRSKTWIAIAGIAVTYVVLLMLKQFEVITPFWGQILDLSLITTISAVGLSLIYGFTGQFSLGHAAFYGIGAYTAGIITKTYGDSYLLFVAALLAGAVVAGLIGFLIGLPILRLKSDYLGIATLGFGIIVKVVMDNSDKFFPSMGGPRGMLGVPQLTNFTWVFWITVGAVVLAWNLINSSYGRAMISIREDETAADIMGVDTTRFKTLAFVVGCALAGLAGGLYAHRYPFLHPSLFDFLKSFDVLLVVVLGGLGSLTGTIVTTVGWVFFMDWLQDILPQNLLDWRGVIYALVLIVVMIGRPQGLLGGKELSLFGKKSGRTPTSPTKGGGNGRATA